MASAPNEFGRPQWSQSQATWFNRLTGTAWGTAGVGLDGIDAKATPEESQDWYNEYPTRKSYNITALTQQWVNGTAQNYGVLFWATNEDTRGYDLRFRASEAYGSDPNDKPYLEVVWSQTSMTVYFLKDHLSSIRAAVDENGDDSFVVSGNFNLCIVSAILIFD